MGNYKFRFSDMIPNAWFYKLKDMNKNNRKHSSSSPTVAEKPHLSEQRKSYHFTRDLTFQQIQKTPRKSTRRKQRNRRPPPPISAGCSCRATLESVWAKPDPDSTPENSSPSSSDPDSVLSQYGPDPSLLSCSNSCKLITGDDVVIDENHLAPIITKKNEATKIERSLSVKVVKENFVNSAGPARRFSVTSSSPGVRLRTNSPRIWNRRRSVSSNSSSGGVSESVAVVKSSKDPWRDFRESMVEMIVENNIRASKDLEELLACYLSLNSDEYHDLIVNVFKQIWFDFIHLRLN